MSSEKKVAAFPRVVPVGESVEIVVDPIGVEPALVVSGDYSVRFFSKVDRTDDVKQDLRTDERGALRVPAAFRAQGEYTLEVRRKDSEDLLISEQFYAVSRELAALRPFKGDIHMHTTGSDGKNTTQEMMVRARELGMDFVAITDHDNFAPSRQAVQEAATLGLGLLVLTGEEVTIRGIGGHVLSLNATAAVGGKRRWTPETENEYAEIAARLAGRELIGPLTAESYSTAVWTATKIREAGGLALMAHPFWEGSKGKYYPPRCVYQQLLRDGLLDGIELLGGSPTAEGNLLAVANYGDERGGGQRLAITGSSDAHSTAEVGRKFTIAFAERLTDKDIIGAITGRKTVACDTMLGPEIAVFGPFELVEYAFFLLRVFYPMRTSLAGHSERFWQASAKGIGQTTKGE